MTDVSTNQGCVPVATAFGSTSFGGACPTVSGSQVTTTPLSQTESISSATTNVDLYTAQQTTTQTITNGVAGPVGPLSPSTPSYSLTSNVSSTDRRQRYLRGPTRAMSESDRNLDSRCADRGWRVCSHGGHPIAQLGACARRHGGSHHINTALHGNGQHRTDGRHADDHDDIIGGHHQYPG